MNSFSFSSSFLCPLTYQQPLLSNKLSLHSNCLHQHSKKQCCYTRSSVGVSYKRVYSPCIHYSLVCSATPQEGVVAVMNFDELLEKDWTFLESSSTSSKEEYDSKTDQIISAGNILETSKVLVSIGSDEFVDQLVSSSPCQLLLIVHESLLSLACIKERHDMVNCWQGELIYVPDKWAPLDVVFLYFLLGLPFKLDEIFRTLAYRCSPGARVVISHLQGKQALEQQRQQYPDVVVSGLPEKMTLEKVASNHTFVLKEFVDDSRFYLAVLEFKS